MTRTRIREVFRMGRDEGIQTGPTLGSPVDRAVPEAPKRSAFLGLPVYPVHAAQPSFEKVPRPYATELVVGATLGIVAGGLMARDWANASSILVTGTVAGMAVGLLTALLIGSPSPLTADGLLRTAVHVAIVAGFLGILGLLIWWCVQICQAILFACALAGW